MNFCRDDVIWKVVYSKHLYETIYFLDRTNYLYLWIFGSAALLFIIGLGAWLLIKRFKLQQDENSSSSSEKNCLSHMYTVDVKEEYGPDSQRALHSAPVGKFQIQLSYTTFMMNTKSHPLEPGHLFRFLWCIFSTSAYDIALPNREITAKRGYLSVIFQRGLGFKTFNLRIEAVDFQIGSPRNIIVQGIKYVEKHTYRLVALKVVICIIYFERGLWLSALV